MLIGVVSFSSSPAYATFAQTGQASAEQDLGSFDDPIFGDQIPDGTYQVTARTSSSMCIFYLDPADADARESKEQAIISVDNGNITGIFYISKMYNYLYMGTKEEAAAATNAEGTDASAYIAGDPSEGYVPHLFTMPVPALNYPITFASFSGGEGNERGVWYTRTVVFGMSAAELEAIVANAAGEPSEPEPEPQPENTTEESSEQEPEYAGEDSSGEDETSAPEEETVQPELTTDNINTGEEGDGTGEAGAQSGGSSEKDASGDSATDAGNSTAVGMKATRMSIAGVGGSIDIDLEEPDEPEEVDLPLLTARQILGLFWLGLLIAGVVIRVVLFNRGYDRVRKPPRGSPPVPPTGFGTRRV